MSRTYHDDEHGSLRGVFRRVFPLAARAAEQGRTESVTYHGTVYRLTPDGTGREYGFHIDEIAEVAS